MKNIYRNLLILIGLILSMSLPAFAQSSTARAGRETIFAVTTSNKLFSFNSTTPGTISNPVQITGLQVGESILGIDFRPATRTLYALGSTSRIYTINTSSGAATIVGAGSFTPSLLGAEFGFDFNPSPDRIRIVSTIGQNLRLNPDNGTVVSTAQTDPPVAYDSTDRNAGVNPRIIASGYTNNFAGVSATATSLYDIDANQDTLVLQGSLNSTPVSPNSGRLFTVGSLGIDVTDLGDIDISDVTGTAYGAFNLNGDSISKLYTISLATGAATLVGNIGPMGGEQVRGIAVALTGETLLGVTSNNMLVSFNAMAPGTIIATKPITGLQTGENLVGLDFRPATGQLIGVSNMGTVYNINPSTGRATAVGPSAVTPSGTAFGVDFNPAPDRIRFVSNNGQDLRINPDNGTIAGTDKPLAYAPGDANAAVAPSIVAAAYTNNVAGTPATGTTLYEIDSNLNLLVTQGSVNATPTNPNDGQLFTIAPLGVDTTDNASLDISGVSGIAYAALTVAGSTSSGLYRIALPTAAQTTNVATLVGLIGPGNQQITALTTVPQVEVLLGLTTDGRLVRFNARKPDTLIGAPVTITGLSSNEMLVGIDFRPVSGILYGLSNASRVYTINPVTGAATPVGPAPLTTPLMGTEFGFDFNPVPDRIRVVSNAGQDLRLNPNNGALAATDGTTRFATNDPNAGQTPNIVGSAYTNNFGGARNTTLYNIDSNLNILTTQGTTPAVTPVISPNDGIQLTVGSLGIDASDVVGFDISELTGRAYAAIQLNGETSSRFYTIDLNSGAATAVGSLPVGGMAPLALRDISVFSNTNLSVVVTAPTTPTIAGNNITYNIVLANGNAEDINGITLMAPVPTNTSFVSVMAPAGFTCQTPAAGATTGNISCSGPSLAANSTVSFSVVVLAAGTTSNAMAPLNVTVKSASADITNVRFDNTTSSAAAIINQPGPDININKLDVNGMRLRAKTISKGKGNTPFIGTTVLINGVAFADAPKIKRQGKLLIQTGRLVSGITLNNAIPKGQPVTITFLNSTGGATVVTFTR